MSHIIDDVARILASPTPRRRALKMLGSTLAGGVLAALGVNRLAGQATVQSNNQGGGDNSGGKNCGRGCPGNQHCCPGFGQADFCAPGPQQCCGNNTCPPPQKCCGSGANAFCAKG